MIAAAAVLRIGSQVEGIENELIAAEAFVEISHSSNRRDRALIMGVGRWRAISGLERCTFCDEKSEVDINRAKMSVLSSPIRKQQSSLLRSV